MHVQTRNFLIFVAILLSCVGTLTAVLIKSDYGIENVVKRVYHTQNVIIHAEELAAKIEAMLAAQRGYLLSNKSSFFQEYQNHKNAVSKNIAQLSALTADNPSQQSRTSMLRESFKRFSEQLDLRSKRFSNSSNTSLEGVEAVNKLKSDISRLNEDILNEEYRLLEKRVRLTAQTKQTYFQTLLVGLAVGTLLLLLLNGFLLKSGRKRADAESIVEDHEKRFQLAIEGTQDGIFDWDIGTDNVFYSKQFFAMLGDDRGAYEGTCDDYMDLIHPKDKDRLWKNKQMYLNNELSEYVQEFRMRHTSGRWVWVQARGKALFNNSGAAYRMVGGHSDITHMVKARERLEKEKTQAIEASSAKSEFLAHMSHEIRTPLTAITGIAEIFMRNLEGLSAKQKKLVSTLNTSAVSLKDLINDVLDFSKIESGEIELADDNVDIFALCEEVISMMALRAKEKKITFTFDYDDVSDVMFKSDKVRLRQILVNLLGNAIKFTDKGGVSVKATRDKRGAQDYIRFDVSDTGVGIAPERFDTVFEEFKQADASVSRKFGGTGLGLPISRNLARLMGGDISMSSQMGQGSTFSLLLPCFIDDDDEQSPACNKKIKTQKIKKLNDTVHAALNKDTKALLVDDYEGNIVVIGYMLEDVGIKFDVARNGLEAINLIESNDYTFVLMDVQMPEMDGFTATSHVRDRETTEGRAALPIIGMTAHALVGDKDKCIEAGMTDYLPKPIVEEDLKVKILAVLKDIS